MNKLLSFVVGSAVGTAVGAAVSAALAPQSGELFQTELRSKLQEAKVAGEVAETETKAAFRQRFREQVNDPDALTESA